MPVTYIQRSTASDLTGGADFSYAITDGAATTLATLAVSVAASTTDISYGFTASGVPSTLGATGNYTIELEVRTGNNNTLGAISLTRINSAGVAQTTSATSAEQTLSAGTKTYSFTSINLGTWASGDRLRVDYRIRNSNTMTAQTVTLGFNTINSEIITPFASLVTATATSALGSATVSATSKTTNILSASANLGSLTAQASAAVVRNATGSAALGSATVQATSKTTHIVSGQSNFQGATVQATSKTTHIVSGQSNFQGATATATANINNEVSATAVLNGLTAQANNTIGKQGTASAELGSVVSQATATINNETTATALLGALIGQATAQTQGSNTATATLGELAAQAQATITPVNKPVSSGGRIFVSPSPKPIIKPVTKITEIDEPKPRQFATIKATGSVTVPSAAIKCSSKISWIAELDDLEILELL